MEKKTEATDARLINNKGEDRHTVTDRQRQTNRHRQRQRDRGRERDTHTHTHTKKDSKRWTELPV